MIQTKGSKNFAHCMYLKKIDVSYESRCIQNNSLLSPNINIYLFLFCFVFFSIKFFNCSFNSKQDEVSALWDHQIWNSSMIEVQRIKTKQGSEQSPLAMVLKKKSWNRVPPKMWSPVTMPETCLCCNVHANSSLTLWVILRTNRQIEPITQPHWRRGQPRRDRIPVCHIAHVA